MFTSAVSVLSKCLKSSVQLAPASSPPVNHEIIEGKHSIFVYFFVVVKFAELCLYNRML